MVRFEDLNYEEKIIAVEANREYLLEKHITEDTPKENIEIMETKEFLGGLLTFGFYTLDPKTLKIIEVEDRDSPGYNGEEDLIL